MWYACFCSSLYLGNKTLNILGIEDNNILVYNEKNISVEHPELLSVSHWKRVGIHTLTQHSLKYNIL